MSEGTLVGVLTVGGTWHDIRGYVLKPGAYTAKAQIGTELLTASFDIAAGQERDILLGN